MGLRTIQFLALVFTALALIPGGAHRFSLLNKIGIPQDSSPSGPMTAGG
jgi:hypothetical protein